MSALVYALGMLPVRLARVVRLVGLILALVVGLVGLAPRVAAAYTPPPPNGAVTDTSGKLSAEDDRVLEAHIASYRARTANELAVLVVGSLGNETIDDVAYGAFNTWGVGKKGADNGVLLVIAPNERKMRIETGKGVGDRLTDLESSHILRERVGPLLKQERFREAILAGLNGIETALDRGGPVPIPAGTKPVPPQRSVSLVALILPIIVLGFCVFVVGGTILLIILAARRSGRSRSSSSWSSSSSSYESNSSSYGSSSSSSSFDFGSSSSSSSSDYGGSSGGSDFGSSSGGSDFGGGSSGGGGSSDSY